MFEFRENQLTNGQIITSNQRFDVMICRNKASYFQLEALFRLAGLEGEDVNITVLHLLMVIAVGFDSCPVLVGKAVEDGGEIL